MGFSDYTSSLFGSMDWKGYSAPNGLSGDYDFKERNRKESIKKDSNGRTIAGDVITQWCDHFYTSGQAIQSQYIIAQSRIVANFPLAILAVPVTYGNHQNTEKEKLFQYQSGCINEFNENPSYRYVVIGKGNEAITEYWDNRYNNNYARRINTIDVLRLNPPTEIGELPPIRERIPSSFSVTNTSAASRSNQPNGNLLDLVNKMQSANSNSSTGVRFYAISQDIVFIDSIAIQTIIEQNIGWAARTDSVFKEMRWFTCEGCGNGINIGYNDIGAVIASGIPIFTISSYEQMIHYFQGEEFVSDNDTTAPPDDWSTDWDVYVRGANKPNIYVTMKSDKLNEWLESDENTAGISKNDIKVEWRIREDINGKPPADDYNLIEWKKTNYDKQLDTSYIDLSYLTNKVYWDANSEVSGNTIDSADVGFLLPYYAEWEFRISWNKYSSVWCYAKIGVIGSPSVPDFSIMRNSGGQTSYGFNDSSTVTIHYDEYPPGYDPYPTPPKPSTPGIIGGNTLPTTPNDEALGLGLLTTTYRLTTEQCEQLGAFLWNFDIFEKIKALNTSPLDNIIAIKIMPYAVSGSPREIIIGNVSTSINAEKIGALPLYEVGTLEYDGRYGNFLDRGGDTTATLFLPFIGFIPIDPAWFTDKKLTVYYAFDAVTGTCRAIIAVDRIAVANYTSTCGVDIPLSMGVRSQIEAAFATASMGLLLAPISPTISATSIIGGFATPLLGDNQIQRTGGVSPITAQYETRMCYIVIESVNANYPKSMAHDNGLPCNSTYTLSQLRGFTQTIETVDLTGINGATQTELEQIRSFLSTGVYL